MKSKLYSIGLNIFCLICLIVSCTPASSQTAPAPTQPPPPALDPSSIGFVCEDGFQPETEVASSGFVEGQLILVGLRENVITVADSEGLNMIQLCPLSYIPDQQDSVMGLYQIPSNTTSEALLDIINTKYKDMGVTAELNYVISSSQATGSCFSPYTDGGSPNGTVNRVATADMLDQWALGSNGINLTYARPTGWNDVHVAVFDTAPKQLIPAELGISRSHPSRAAERLGWPNDETFFLYTYDFLGSTHIQAQARNPDDGTNGSVVDLSDHGLGVASWIRIVSPESPTYLLRVLDDNGCGDVQKLIRAINSFMALMRSHEFKKVVINLSLGVRQGNGTGEVPLLKETLNTVKNDKDIEVVIVAAAGNDSANLSTAAPPQFPASLDFVIGVAASNIQGQISCYSNNEGNGGVMAPGGDGGPDNQGNNCASRTLNWDQENLASCDSALGMENCGYGVITLATPIKLGADEKWITGYGYWSGTSFAAPLASGQEALKLKSVSP